jgi:hypothetical protein
MYRVAVPDTNPRGRNSIWHLLNENGQAWSSDFKIQGYAMLVQSWYANSTPVFSYLPLDVPMIQPEGPLLPVQTELVKGLGFGCTVATGLPKTVPPTKSMIA